MAAASTNTTCLLPSAPHKLNRPGRNVLGRRAAVVDGSLQVGSIDRSAGALKDSPPWSPAFMLAALKWAEDDAASKNASDRDGDLGRDRDRDCGEDHRNQQLVLPFLLAQKRLGRWPNRGTDDAQDRVQAIEPKARRMAGRPRVDLPEKLNFESHRTPALYKYNNLKSRKPTPPSLSLDTAVKLVSSPSPSPFSPDLQYRNRVPPRQQQRQEEEARRRPRDTQKEASISVSEVARLGAETGWTQAGQQEESRTRSRQNMPHSIHPSAAPPSPMASPTAPISHRSRMFERVASLARPRKKSNVDGSPRATFTKRSHASPISPISNSSNGTFADPDRSKNLDSGRMPEPTIMTVRGAIPQIDTPRGASNSAERLVAVRCRGVTVKVPVGNDTSVEDVLRACQGEMERIGHPIDFNTSVVLEPFSQPGLERRLRRYERIRDIVNSWNADSQHTLIVLPDSPDTDKQLSLASVPKTDEAPSGFVIALYYAQRPGKWSKRYITLAESGQMIASKKPNPKPSDKDTVNLCHLSDYDLYQPTEAEMRKQLKPPKRYCYAIKSQQRSTIFVNSDKYVHFFCTDDPNIARKFRSSVYGWRSWYLVNTKLQLYKPEPPPATSHSNGGYMYNGRPSVDMPSRRSIDSSRHRGNDTSPVTSRPAVPPVPPLPLLEKDAPSFAANGLLGREYEKRKQEAQRNEAAASAQQLRGRAFSGADEGPFIDGPNLLNNYAAFAASASENARPQTSGSDRIASRPNSPVSPSWYPGGEHSLQRRNTRAAAGHSLARRPSTSHAPPTRAASVRSRVPPITQHHHLHNQPPVPSLPPHNQQPTRNKPGPPEPLIDLTPSFVEAPQWSREGRGRGVHAPQGKPLIDLATGPALVPGAAAKFLRDNMPPQKPVRRPDHYGQPGPQFTLLEQCEMNEKLAAGRGRGNTIGAGAAAAISGGGGGEASGLARRATVRSTASAGTRSGTRPVTSGGGTGGSPSGAGAYVQSRGKVMGVSEEDRERVRERLRSMDGGRPAWAAEGIARQMSLRGRRE